MKAFRTLTLMLALLLPSAALAADDEAPTLAILSFGRAPTYALTEAAILDTLEVYGYLTAAERAELSAGNDLLGEDINILYREANFDFPTVSLIVEDALDKGADILLTLSDEVGRVAATALGDMEDPPALFFAIVSAPYHLGLGQSPCIKPDYVTGTAMYVDFFTETPLPLLQNPSMKRFGILVDPADPAVDVVMRRIALRSALLGLTFDVATYSTTADLPMATQSLVDKDVEFIVVAPLSTASRGIPAIIDAAYGIPVISMIVSDVHMGVTLGSGFDGWYREGATAASMMVAYLKGELDIGSTMINLTEGLSNAANLDSAELQNVELSPAVMEALDFVIQDGEAIGDIVEIPGAGATASRMSLDERMAADAELIASLTCTEAMIAEQEAALAASN